jgi:thioredoxin-like negative regulator of GroEL
MPRRAARPLPRRAAAGAVPTLEEKRAWPSRNRLVVLGGLLSSALIALVAWVFWDALASPNARFQAAWTRARDALKAGRAADAERELREATRQKPAFVEPWLLLLEILRLEDRTIEANHIGWEAIGMVRAADRLDVLRAITLAIFADTPDDLARTTLRRWIEADATDLEAEVAWLRRIGARARPGDPDRSTRLARLESLVSRHPEHIASREALVQSYAELGLPDRGRKVLETWPEPLRDIRYHRLAGRWALEFDHDDARAAESLARVTEAVPHDWRTWFRLARALQRVGRETEAEHAASVVTRLREILEPTLLGERLDRDFARLDQKEACLDLALLCDQAGQTRLADAWRIESNSPRSAVAEAVRSQVPRFEVPRDGETERLTDP